MDYTIQCNRPYKRTLLKSSLDAAQREAERGGVQIDWQAQGDFRWIGYIDGDAPNEPSYEIAAAVDAAEIHKIAEDLADIGVEGVSWWEAIEQALDVRNLPLDDHAVQDILDEITDILRGDAELSS